MRYRGAPATICGARLRPKFVENFLRRVVPVLLESRRYQSQLTQAIRETQVAEEFAQAMRSSSSYSLPSPHRYPVVRFWRYRLRSE